MASEFLDHSTLGPAIVDLLTGADIRCAVAFWGDGSAEKLFSSRTASQARILCDISLGGTNPNELRRLGAPTNGNLKHLRKLHAKAYLSDRGAIVCSANASDNGIGFVDVAGLIEAGVRVAPGSSAYGQIASWFEVVWKSGSELNETALAEADEIWKRRVQPRGAQSVKSIPDGAPSLLQTVVKDPSRFRGVGFVFTSGKATIKDREEASFELLRLDDARDVAILSGEDRRKLLKWDVGNLFSGWSEQDLDAWPRRFVCIHRPGRRASYWYYKRAYEVLLGDERGVVFAERPKGLRASLGFQHSNDAMMASDREMIDQIFAYCEQHGHWLCENGESLARLIEEVEASHR